MERRGFPQYKDDLGCFLEDLRVGPFKNRTRAAEAYGVNPSTILRYEDGTTALPLRYLAWLAIHYAKRKETGEQLADEQQQGFLDELNKVVSECCPGEQPFRDWGDVKRRAKRSPRPSLPLVMLITVLLVAIVVALIALFLVAGVISWNPLLSSKTTIWQESFDPIQKAWDQPSARWEDIEGRGAVLVESGPDNFGKVESETIRVDIQSHPILKVDVSKVDLHACYSVQILDKETETAKTVIENEEGPGVHTISLAEEMDWQGSHSFTINIWISGEGKSAIFDLISIEAE
ncbi:MAG: hypothetical protein JXB07_08230 [Anaerolineae bacterium]|nr:hypothetical protein [Anaerolineae bacterium]